MKDHVLLDDQEGRVVDSFIKRLDFLWLLNLHEHIDFTCLFPIGWFRG